MVAFTVNPNLFPKLGFDYGKDFALIGMVARIPTLLEVARVIKAAHIKLD